MEVLKIILIFLFNYTILKGQKQYPLYNQGAQYLQYTSIDTNSLNQFKPLNKKNLKLFRQKLTPYLNTRDCFAIYLYGLSYDYEYKLGNRKKGEIALKYFKMAADMNCAGAEKEMYYQYRYRYINDIKGADSLAYQYLKRSIIHGDSSTKSVCYEFLAFAYGDTNSSDKFVKLIGPNKDSCLWYLQQSVQFDPKNSSSLDYLGDIYEEKKMYGEAMNTYLQSDNEQMALKVAEWLIEGDKVKMDVQRGLNIIYKIAEKVKKAEAKGDEYMGSTYPIHLLNDLFWCKKLITREQVREYIIENWPCDP